MLSLDPGRSFDRALEIDVRDDLRTLFGRIPQPHQSLRNSVVHDLDHAAANQFLVFHERKIRLDAGCVAIHHEADGARGGEHGDLRILVAVSLPEREGIVPCLARSREQRSLNVLGLNRPDGVAMHSNHVQHGLAINRKSRERPQPFSNAR